jgi:hypothetical protein
MLKGMGMDLWIIPSDEKKMCHKVSSATDTTQINK